MAVVLMSKEIKVSDNNYGNRTSKLEISVDAENMSRASFLLEQWATLMKEGVSYDDEETMTVKEAREMNRHKQDIADVMNEIAMIAV